VTGTLGREPVSTPSPHAEEKLETKMSRKLLTLTTFAVIALFSTACRKAPAATSGSAGNTTATARDKAVKFAECMRKNGLSDFPDPNAAGEFAYGISVSPAVFDKAVFACKDLQPPGTLSTKRAPEQQRAGLKFAQCMRESGVKDFPDPFKGEPLIDTNRIPSTARKGGMGILDAAMKTCRPQLDAAAKGQ
jgi:hypothetical protein